MSQCSDPWPGTHKMLVTCNKWNFICRWLITSDTQVVMDLKKVTLYISVTNYKWHSRRHWPKTSDTKDASDQLQVSFKMSLTLKWQILCQLPAKNHMLLISNKEGLAPWWPASPGLVSYWQYYRHPPAKLTLVSSHHHNRLHHHHHHCLHHHHHRRHHHHYHLHHFNHYFI